MHRESTTDVVSLIPLVVTLWIGYLVALLLIDSVFYPTPIFPFTYYLISWITALAVLVLARYQPARDWLGNAFVPVVIILPSIGSVALAVFMSVGVPGPASGPEAVLLRTMPLLLMALILIAWQYGWPAVILYTVGTDLLLMGLYIWLAQTGHPFIPPLTILLIESISFLVVGYFISVLMARLQEQQRALALANTKLVHHAATLEELTISRERNRMARELHDTVAHTLSALSVQLETVKAYWDVDSDAAKQMLDSSISASRVGLQETRSALRSLRASPLEDLGLILALRRLAEQAATRANVTLKLQLPQDTLSLASEAEQAVYRVAQEALNNATQHANANQLDVTLHADASVVTLEIRDDGVGFNPTQSPTAGHYGLIGMQERSEVVGGQLAVDSQPGQGTIVRFTLGA